MGRDEAGQALVEFLLVIPALVLLVFGIIEMGAAWRTFQVVTNTAREGARIAVLHNADQNQVEEAIEERLRQAGLDPELATVEILCETDGGGCFGTDRTGTSTEVQVGYPHTFLFLRPVVRFLGGDGEPFGTVTLQTGTVMRNE